MLWARVIRGRSSIAKAVTLACCIWRIRSRFREGFMNPTVTVVGRIQATSSGVGGPTVVTRSAVEKSSARSTTIWAPAARYISSG